MPRTKQEIVREDGELLWPEREGPEEIKQAKMQLRSYGYNGQYQQRPVPAGGGLFKREWFRYYDDLGRFYILHDPHLGHSRPVEKSDCWRFVTADLALTTKDWSDYTVVQVWDVERVRGTDNVVRGGNMFLVDQWREQTESPFVEDHLRNVMHRWEPLFLGVEDRHYGTGVLQRFLRDGLPVKPLKADRDKITRSHVSQIWFELGKIWFNPKHDYIASLESELTSFPNGDYNDQVDATAYAASYANNRNLWEAPKKPDKFPPGSYGDILGMESVFNPRPNTSVFSMDRGLPGLN
jgi:predicted phage terminase large subunit-like protein